MLDCNVAGCLLSFVLFDTFAKSCGVKVSHIEMACIIVYRPISILAVLDRGRGDLYVAAVFTDFRIFLSFVFDTFTKSCRMKVSRIDNVWNPLDFRACWVLDCHVAAQDCSGV